MPFIFWKSNKPNKPNKPIKNNNDDDADDLLLILLILLLFVFLLKPIRPFFFWPYLLPSTRLYSTLLEEDAMSQLNAPLRRDLETVRRVHPQMRLGDQARRAAERVCAALGIV